MEGSRRAGDLLLALALHLAALPLWFIQAFLWEAPTPDPQDRAATEAALAVFGAIVMGAYLGMLAAIVAWWRQGRRRLFLLPLAGAAIGFCPCLLFLATIPSLRRAVVPRPPDGGG